MIKHPFRKVLGLTVLYSIIIIGIFVLQFRNQSEIFKNIGSLRMSAAEKTDSDGNVSLQNTLTVSFKGISFSADETHPLIMEFSGKNPPAPENLVFLSWEQSDSLSFRFNFSQNVSLVFSVSDETPSASLTVTAILPQKCRSVSLFYKPVSGFSVTDQTKTRQLFSSKAVSYRMNAGEIQESHVLFTKDSLALSYRKHEESSAFTFASIPSENPLCQNSLLEENLTKFKADLVEKCEANFSDSLQMSENAVAAYLAEKSLKGEFASAMSKIPDSIKKGNRRSYLTAPYFNTLVQMNKSLEMATENISSMADSSIKNNSTGVFSAPGFSVYGVLNQNKQQIQQLVKLLKTSDAHVAPNLAEATGIIRFYTELLRKNSPLAGKLESAVSECLIQLTKCSVFSESGLDLFEKEIPAGIAQTAETGAVLYRYGKLTGNISEMNAGTIILNTMFRKNQNMDLRILAKIYPVLISENPYYPHMEVLDYSSTNPVWAWTCSSDIKYSESSDGSQATITVDFFQGESHYIIIRGIKPFSEIEIYGLSFHTDHRFETYNSSGSVYDRESKTLFLKSRHKSAKEIIKLDFTPAKPKLSAQESSEPKAAAETEPSTENNRTEVEQ